MEKIQKKEETATSVKVVRYSFLALALILYFAFHCYEGGFFAFLGYMFFSDWAAEPLFTTRS